jgi:2'-5' RNA ligase
MRLFTGLDLPAHVSAALERLLETLRPMARLRWTPVANLHVTTKFIGEWPAARLEEMKSALAAVPGRTPVLVAIRGLGWRPNPHNPRLLWAGVDAPALNDLARDLDTALAKLGIAREQRAFTAHLTLARIGKPAPLEPVQKRIAGLPPADFGTFEADRFFLYLSEPGSAGSVYTKLAEFPFAK